MDSVLVCGVDEAGRGPLAGPVYAAAVILDKKRRINGLADSKVLTPDRREVLARRIKDRAIAWAIASATVEEIDRINIFHASMLAMRRAVQALRVRPGEAWVDGNHCPDLGCRARAIVYCDAMKLASGVGLKTLLLGKTRVAAARSRLAKFDEFERCLRRDYADVLTCADAATHVMLVDGLLHKAREELRRACRSKS